MILVPYQTNLITGSQFDRSAQRSHLHLLLQLPALAHQHRLYRCVWRHHLAAAHGSHVDVHHIYRVRSLRANHRFQAPSSRTVVSRPLGHTHQRHRTRLQHFLSVLDSVALCERSRCHDVQLGYCRVHGCFHPQHDMVLCGRTQEVSRSCCACQGGARISASRRQAPSSMLCFAGAFVQRNAS